MRYSPHGRPEKLAVLALVYLLVLSALPASPASPRGARRAAAGRVDAQVPSASTDAPFRQRNLVSSLPGVALVQDPLLVNPWGISTRGESPFWVANNGTNTSTLYRGGAGGAPVAKNTPLRDITIPGGPPTGTVGNTTNDFVITRGSNSGPAFFIFASTTGDITGWNPTVNPSAAVLARHHDGHSHTGLALANNGANLLYAADFDNNHIDVYNASFAPTTVPGGFLDPTIPSDYRPYNIQRLPEGLYVTYAKVDPNGDPERGPGKGFVRKFDANGVRDPAFAIDNGKLNAPWGLAHSPPSFGPFGDALIVGNTDFLGPSINAYNASTGEFRGTFLNEAGGELFIEGLRALARGNGGNGGDPNKIYFTAGINQLQAGLFGSLEAPTDTVLSHFQFSDELFQVQEGDGHIDITVTRSGVVSDAATVDYAMYDLPFGTRASQKSDYELALGRLRFAPGETSKTFRVLVVDDRFNEGGENTRLILSNPTGVRVALGGRSESTLSIGDNDSSTSAANPIDEAQFFVRQHYLDFLNREPDAGGLAFWTGNITSCGSDTGCREVRRVNVSAAFFLSIEFQETGLLAYLTHRAAFGRRPLYGEFLRSTQALQRGFAFGTPGADAQLEANKQEFFADFVRSPEFVLAFPSAQTPAEFVDALFAGAGVTPSAAERQAAIDEFGTATTSADLSARARALRRVAENAAFKQQEFTTAFVLMEYFGYLRRDPDQAGFNFWRDKLDDFGGDFVAAEMVKAFISSIEYRQRFGP